MTIIARSAFERADEYRELLLSQEDVFRLREVIGSPKDERVRRTQIALSASESEARKQFESETKRLQAEGFTSCEARD